MESDFTMPPAKGFLSYVHDDNKVFENVVDKLNFHLSGYFHAHTGRKLSLFLDHASISWGENWEDSILAQIENAAVFIPVITMRYFESQPCHDEFMRFYTTAKNKGLEGLILPIVLAGAESLINDERKIVKIIASLQYRDIEDAFLDGYTSSSWRHKMAELVKELDKKIGEAEHKIVDNDPKEPNEDKSNITTSGNKLAKPDTKTSTKPKQSVDASPQDTEPQADISKLTILMNKLHPQIDDATLSINDFVNAMDPINEIDFANLGSPKEKTRILAVANAIRTPAKQLENKAEKLEKLILNVDNELNILIKEFIINKNEQAQVVIEELFKLFDDLDDLAETFKQMEDVIGALQAASALNINLRKSMNPAIHGIRSMINAMNIFTNWKTLKEKYIN